MFSGTNIVDTDGNTHTTAVTVNDIAYDPNTGEMLMKVNGADTPTPFKRGSLDLSSFITIFAKYNQPGTSSGFEVGKQYLVSICATDDTNYWDNMMSASTGFTVDDISAPYRFTPTGGRSTALRTAIITATSTSITITGIIYSYGTVCMNFFIM